MAIPHGAVVCLQCVIVVFPDHTHLLYEVMTNRHTFAYAQMPFINAHSYVFSCARGLVLVLVFIFIYTDWL